MVGSVCEGLGMAVDLYMLGVRLGLLCSAKGCSGFRQGPWHSHTYIDFPPADAHSPSWGLLALCESCSLTELQPQLSTQILGCLRNAPSHLRATCWFILCG